MLGASGEFRLTELTDAETIAFDVTDAEAVQAGVDRAAELLEGLDCLVHAAGVDCEWAPVGEMTVETWDETVQTNLSGTFYVCRAALPHLVAAGAARSSR